MHYTTRLIRSAWRQTASCRRTLFRYIYLLRSRRATYSSSYEKKKKKKQEYDCNNRYS